MSGEELPESAAPTNEELGQQIALISKNLTSIAQYLNEGFVKDIEKAVTTQLSPAVDAIQKRFVENETALTKIIERINQGGGGGGGNELLGLIKTVIEKIPIGGGGGGGFGAEIQNMAQDIIRGDLKEMLYAQRVRNKQHALPERLEGHVVIEPTPHS